MSKMGIDVSVWQDVINWEKASKDKHVDFAILKAGGSDSGFYKDKYFERNYSEAKKHNVPVGCYYFVGKNFISEKDGIADAKRFLEIIKNKQFEYPVVLDVESTDIKNKDGVTKACIAFLNELEKNGYYAMIYSYESFFYQNVNLDQLNKFDKWVANISNMPKIAGYGMHQYSWTGKIDGITGDVDLNYCYRDYPEIIKSAGLNNFNSKKLKDVTIKIKNLNDEEIKAFNKFLSSLKDYEIDIN